MYSSVLILLALDLILILVLVETYSSLYHKRTADIIILGFNPDIKKYFEDIDGVEFYELNSDSLEYLYYAEKIVIITHSAKLSEGKILLALNEKPDLTTLYAIETNTGVYKAVPIEELAERIHAYSVFIVACDLEEKAVIHAFKGHAETIYYYKCPVSIDEAVIDIENFINNKPVREDCVAVVALGAPTYK